VRPHANAGEEMALSKSRKISGRDLLKVTVIDIPRCDMTSIN
jgi:hypothetical protein